MPCLAKKPFSFAMINGDASVSAMNPSTAFVTSGFAAAAYNGRSDRADAPASVAAATAPLSTRRRAPLTAFSMSLFLVIRSPDQKCDVGGKKKATSRSVVTATARLDENRLRCLFDATLDVERRAHRFCKSYATRARQQLRGSRATPAPLAPQRSAPARRNAPIRGSAQNE
jgi:hypothetical protein